MPRRPCLGTPHRVCTTLAEPGKSRCRTCQHDMDAARYAARPQYHGTWPTQARQAIATYRQQHGDICPGWQRDPHPIHPTQWTCDHDLGPLCRSCNSTKGATVDKQRRAAN